MPTPIYMNINDLGIPGSVDIAGREETVEIIEVKHDVHIPVDIHSGASTGVRVHGKFTVQAGVDKATPLLYKACVDGEVLDKVVFSFYQIDAMGAEIEYYTITLANARCTSVVMEVPNVKNQQKEHYPHMVEYSFHYQTITWLFTDGALEHTDDWKATR